MLGEIFVVKEDIVYFVVILVVIVEYIWIFVIFDLIYDNGFKNILIEGKDKWVRLKVCMWVEGSISWRCVSVVWVGRRVVIII